MALFLNSNFFIVLGSVKDYFVAVALHYTGSKDFLRKEFFWCSSSNYIFAQLPAPVKAHDADFNKLQTYFTGEFDRIIISGGTEGTVIDSDLILPPKHVTELDRLAWTVHQIEHDCQVVPQGAFKMTPLREVRRNEAFKGLKKDDVFAVEKYQHFRAVETKDKREQIERDEAVYNHNFLDDLSGDFPKHTWNIQKDTTGTSAIIRNQLWPGYYGYHRANSQIYGGLFIGYGIKNLDLPFML